MKNDKILLIDAGNSCAKWKLIGGSNIQKGVLSYEDSTQKMNEWKALQPQRVWIAEVGRFDLTAQLQQVFSGDAVHPVLSGASCLSVINQYPEPHRLGIDRLLAMAEGYYLAGSQACAVLDVGTAATFDVVADNGVHQGGHIVPGLAMLRDSLLQNARQVRLRDDEIKTQLTSVLGVGTADAVLNGSWAMLLGWIRQELAEFHRHYPDAPIYLAGGLAEHVRQQLSGRVTVHKDLVLDALRRLALPL